MRGRSFVVVTCISMLTAQAQAYAKTDAGDDVSAINQRIRADNEAIARDNANRLAEWEKERVRVAAENAASKAAFARAEADHARDMANWRAETARLAQASHARAGTPKPAAGTATTRQADAAAGKRICRTEAVTGSLVQKRKVCMTAAERDAAGRSAGSVLREMSGAGCLRGTDGC